MMCFMGPITIPTWEPKGQEWFFIIQKEGFRRAIHSLENGYFRSKFESDLEQFNGNSGMGIISDTDPQPILFNSHMGRFAITISEPHCEYCMSWKNQFLKKKKHFTENFQGNVNPTEVVANLICDEDDFVSGIENVHHQVKGSCSMLILTPDSIIAARDKLGRTTIIIGRKEGSYAVASETCAFPNTGYEIEYYLGPGEIVEITADGYKVLKPARETDADLFFPLGLLRLSTLLL